MVALLAGVAALAVLPLIELRVPNPIIVFSLLKSRVFTSAIISMVLNFLAPALGGAAAGAALAAYHAGKQAPSAADIAAMQSTFIYGFQTAFHVCAAIAAIGIFTSLVRGHEEPRRPR